MKKINNWISNKLLELKNFDKNKIISILKLRIINFGKNHKLSIIVLLIVLTINLFIFRGILIKYPEIIRGNSTVITEELVPIFDLRTQYIDGLVQAFSQLTSNYEFRVRYSWISTWTRYYLIIPIMLVLVNAITFLMIFHSIRRIIKHLFRNDNKDQLIKYINISTFITTLIIYLILDYSKITHFYTLILGFGLFFYATSIIIEYVIFNEKIRKKDIALFLLTTMLNPAVHYVVLTVFLLALLISFQFFRFIYYFIKRSKNWKVILRIILTLIGFSIIISLFYLIFYYVFVTEFGKFAIIDSAPITRSAIYYFSLNLGQILTLQIGSTADYYFFNTYIVAAIKRILLIIYPFCTLIVTGIWIIRYKFRKNNVFVFTSFLLFLIGISIFFALGYSSNISAHNLVASIFLNIKNNQLPFLDQIISIISVFFNILRFPHRFSFLFLIGVSYFMTIAMVYLINYLENIKYIKIFKIKNVGIILGCIIFLLPLVLSDKILPTLISGDFGGFLSTYNLESELKRIKTYLSQKLDGKLIIFPSGEIPFRNIQDPNNSDSERFIDKFFIYYLDYPSVYYGNGASKYVKSDYAQIYDKLLHNEPYFYLLRNKGVKYIFYDKQQFVKPGYNFYNNLENDIYKQLNVLEKEKVISKDIDGNYYALYEISDRFVSLKPNLYLEKDWDSLNKIFASQNAYSNFTINDIGSGICNNDSYSLGNKDKIIKDIIYLCLKGSVKFDSRILPYDKNILPIDDYMSVPASFLVADESPKKNSYNLLESIHPGAYNSLDKNYIVLVKKDSSLTFNLKILEEGDYNIELRNASLNNHIHFKLVDSSNSIQSEDDKVLNVGYNYLSKDRYPVYYNFDYNSLLSNFHLKKGNYKLLITKTDSSALTIDNIVFYSSNLYNKVNDHLTHTDVNNANLYKINLNEIQN